MKTIKNFIDEGLTGFVISENNKIFLLDKNTIINIAGVLYYFTWDIVQEISIYIYLETRIRPLNKNELMKYNLL